MAQLGRSWPSLGLHLEPLGRLLTPLGLNLAPLGANLAPLGPNLEQLAASWAHLGTNLPALGALLGASWANLAHSGRQMAAKWAPNGCQLGANWAPFVRHNGCQCQRTSSERHNGCQVLLNSWPAVLLSPEGDICSTSIYIYIYMSVQIYQRARKGSPLRYPLFSQKACLVSIQIQFTI